MPNAETIYGWIDQDSAFANSLERAREAAAPIMLEEARLFADECAETTEAIQKARLRSQNRIILAGKFNKKYSDRPGDINIANVVPLAISPERLAQLQERSAKAEEITAPAREALTDSTGDQLNAQ